MKPLDINSLILTLPQFRQVINDKYIISYPSFISYFSVLNEVSDQDLLRGIGFVYSWMPRILSVNTDQIALLRRCVNQLKYEPGEENEMKAINLTVQFTAGSIVAASKLLHFIFPTKFPIYDSHVYKYCWDDYRAYHYKINNLSKYYLYRNSVLGLSYKQETKKLTAAVTKAVGYSVSDIRAIEFSIFYSSKARTN